MAMGEPKCGVCGSDIMSGMFHSCKPAWNEENAALRAEVESFKSIQVQDAVRVQNLVEDRSALILRNDELNNKLNDSEGDHRQIRGLQIQLEEYRKVVEGCRDVLAQFCGESAPVIAHPPKCGFYKLGYSRDCNCTAKNTANDILLSLKACREILSGQAE